MTKFCNKRRHTLSGKLLILFIVTAIIAVIVVAGFMGWAFRMHMEGRIQPHLELYLDYIQKDLGSPPRKQNAMDLAKRLNVDIHYIGQHSWSTSGSLPTVDDLHYIRKHRHNGVDYGIGHDGDFEYLVARHPDYTLVFSVPQKFQDWHHVVVVIVILLMLILLYHAIRVLFLPVETIRKGIERIGAGELDYRLNINRKDELGALSESINAMADDIQHMLDAKRQLLLAISHELRTPLTRAKVATEMLDHEQQREELHRELDEVEALIEELLETERLNQRHAALNKRKVDLGQLVREVIKEKYADHAIEYRSTDKVIEVEVDVARIKLLVKNIVDNALKHNPEDAKPTWVSVSEENGKAVLCVQDHGSGVKAEHLPHLTEPFYRADPARQRQTGGYGLGLYLCRVVAEAHGGQLTIESKVNDGTRVCVLL